MQALRQLGVGVLIAIASVVLVVGGIFLSLAESLPAPATPTQIPPTLPLSFPTPTATITSVVLTAATTETASPSPTTGLQATTAVAAPCIPPSGWIRVSASSSDTIYALAQRYKTTAENLGTANCLTSFDLPVGFALYVPPVPTVTIVPCGPPGTWVRAHVVQRGDTLFRIALSYGVTYPQLQRANCMGSSTTIYAGQRLWVPNIPTRTVQPGVTTIPDFPTGTLQPTLTTAPPTDTAAPPTDTAAPPTDTSAPPTNPSATATTQPPPPTTQASAE